MRLTTKKDYEKATSQNLPNVDFCMLYDYIKENDDYNSAEMRGVKRDRSMRSNYGDAAVGYVQLLRQGNLCTVEAKVCPEHKTHNPDYIVEVIINEVDESVIKAECKDCAASLGGCKHAIALIAWLYRRSEEPACTDVTCYWNKPSLSNAIDVKKYKEINVIFGKHRTRDDNQENFLLSVLNHDKANEHSSHIVHFFKLNVLQKLSLHHQSILYKGNRDNQDDFIKYSSTFLTSENCDFVSKKTSDQSSSVAWFELRYGRITASTIHEAAHCHVYDGSLVEKILSMQDLETPAMKRGKQLESEVLKIVNKELKKK